MENPASYRPTSFSEMVGNTETIALLEAQLKKENRPHCYMLKGASGCGKTTAIRIMAKQLGAYDIDIHEFNIGDARGIDSARDIIDRMQAYPYGNATIIILDEVHNSTKAFQEALLKPFEDVPDHVYIFMATTEPSKIIGTLRRRFMEFDINPIDNTTMFMYIVNTASKYKVKINKEVTESIIEQAEGSPAKAMVLFSKIMELPEKEQLAVLEVEKTATNSAINLCQALLYKKSWKTIASLISELQEPPETLRRVILSYMKKVLLNPKNTNLHLTAANIINIFSEYNESDAVFAMRCYNCTII